MAGLVKKEDMDDNTDLEVQFILRLPVESARILRALMHAGVSLRDRLLIDIYKDLRHVVFQLDNWIYYGKIYNLPTVIESLKTIDGKSFFKTADISQICICTNEEFGSSEDELSNNNNNTNTNNNKTTNETNKVKANKKFNWSHGLTPPMKNVRKHRFRKTLPKEYVELSEIEREVRTLLRADNDAVSVKWEIVYENENNRKIKYDKPKRDMEEMDIFGDISDDIEGGDEYIPSSIINKQSFDSSSDEKNFETIMELDCENESSSLLRDNDDCNTEMKSFDSDVNYAEFCTGLKHDILDMQNERDQLILKLEGIENYALKERFIDTLNNFEKGIVDKKALLKNVEKYVNN